MQNGDNVLTDKKEAHSYGLSYGLVTMIHPSTDSTSLNAHITGLHVNDSSVV
jgi:hypothetical protein